MNEASHPAAVELEAYVVGALSPERTARFERHVVDCSACTEALSREACFEMALGIVAQDLPAEPVVLSLPEVVTVGVVGRAHAKTQGPKGRATESRGRRAAPLFVSLFGGLAVAASAVLWLGMARGLSVSAMPAGARPVSVEAADAASATPLGPTADAASVLMPVPSGAAPTDSSDGG